MDAIVTNQQKYSYSVNDCGSVRPALWVNPGSGIF